MLTIGFASLRLLHVRVAPASSCYVLCYALLCFVCAVLCGDMLRCAGLCHARLCVAVLCCVVLCCAVLCCRGAAVVLGIMLCCAMPLCNDLLCYAMPLCHALLCCAVL